MTKEEAIAVFECLATEMTAILAGIPKSEAAADQIKRYIDAYDIAISALRIKQKQESECTKCSGIMYRQTDSGKIIPVDQRCGVKITPPCYVPDGDGCAYQIYGDNNDEPIARCKSCPLCQSDKIRHKQKPAHNDPLTLDELREAAKTGDPVWLVGMEDGDGWRRIDYVELLPLDTHGSETLKDGAFGQQDMECVYSPTARGQRRCEMNFKQFIRWRLVCFVQTHIRHCQECLGSNGHCQECNDWHHLFRRDWQRTYWRRKC